MLAALQRQQSFFVFFTWNIRAVCLPACLSVYRPIELSGSAITSRRIINAFTRAIKFRQAGRLIALTSCGLGDEKKKFVLVHGRVGTCPPTRMYRSTPFYIFIPTTFRQLGNVLVSCLAAA